jgi:hypothetical protein
MSDTERFSNRVIGHGMIILLIGLLAGFGLVFSLMEAIAIWPLPAIDVQIPGSSRGWQAAHVGGIMNGIMMAGVALLMSRFELSGKRLAWVGWGMIITGWGNTLFYFAGNFSQNRGLSVAETPFGPGDIWGTLSFLGGGSAMLFTIVATIILAQVAFERARAS